ncbi:MAG TPA: PhzF family phenazine biosynthesis protein [Acidimicrobiales bacterium]|nr:PhzF family phenazine biosynthesis protein [Acidimicrobiales bacterium]
MALEITVVDSFTDLPFAGNPAGVAVVESFPDDLRMQLVAREMNLSETAFLVPRGADEYDLRWFSPTVEVDLCGHATLASAHVLGGEGRFWTRSGLLSCTTSAEGWIEMDFPADPPGPAQMPGALDIPEAVLCGRGKFDLLVELADAEAVRSFVPDLPAIATVPSRCLIVTARSDRPGIDCVSRVFAPSVGIPEDPATGSAHCLLGPFWADRLGRTGLVGEQASARGGIVRMSVAGDRVVLGGRAVTVSSVRMVV